MYILWMLLGIAAGFICMCLAYERGLNVSFKSYWSLFEHYSATVQQKIDRIRELEDELQRYKYQAAFSGA